MGGNGLGKSSGRNPKGERKTPNQTLKASYSSGVTFQNLGEGSHLPLFTIGGVWQKKVFGADKKEAGRSPLNEAKSPEFCSAALFKIEVSSV